MSQPLVLIFHRPAQSHEPRLVQVLADARRRLAADHAGLFERAGAKEVRLVTDRLAGRAFGAALAGQVPPRGGLIVLGSGAVPLLGERDAQRLLSVAASGQARALTNNRYSSDICALGDAAALRGLPPLTGDNALPRWLAEEAGVTVHELPRRSRLALDLDTPLDIALIGRHPDAPPWLAATADEAGLAIPRLDELRAVAADPGAELLIFGRSGSRTLRWLERSVRCRVRFLTEERGLRASTALPRESGTGPRSGRPPRATIGRLIQSGGPRALAAIVAQLADGALLDTRVLLADHLGADEAAWPPAGERFASDLPRPAEIGDSWLRELTVAALESELPILLAAHSVVGPGIPLLLGGCAK